MKKKVSVFDCIVIGFAVFAIFFGAGNLIFPPYLGLQAGADWFPGFLCFILADAGLAVMTVIAMIRGDGTEMSILSHLGKAPARIVSDVAFLCAGPLLAIPRTCATTYEMGVQPLLPGVSSWIFGAVFFAIVLLLTLRPSSVVDIIGKYLTPALLVTLAVLVIKGIVTPIGAIAPIPQVEHVTREGFLAGYQTMDVFGAFAITAIIVKTVGDKGYTEKKTRFRVICVACVVATLGLFAVYGGLTFLGATTSELGLEGITQTELLVRITELLLGKFGMILLALIVFFACLTTAIGLLSSASEHYSALWKLPYPVLVIVFAVVSMLISNVGIPVMVRFAAPMLGIVYPVLMTQVILSFFDRRLKNDNVYRGAALAALAVSLLSAARDLGLPLDFLRTLPFAELGLEWLLPAAAGGILGALIPSRRK